MTGAAANGHGPIVIERRVLLDNAHAFRKWCMENGGPASLPEWEEWEPHVTVLYSASNLPWPTLEEDELTVEIVGHLIPLRGNLLGLPVKSSVLAHRHFSLRDAGWRFDFAGYRPHVTLWRQFKGGGIPKPFEGVLRLGPERAKTPKRFRGGFTPKVDIPF